MKAIKAYATDLRYVPWMFGEIRRFGPDVVYVRDMTFPFFLAMLARPFFRYAVVFQKTFPNELRWFDPVWVHAHKLPWLWSFCRHVENATLHRLLRQADAVIPISPWMADDLHERWKIRRSLLHSFGMGIDRHDADVARSRDGAGPIRLAYVGTMGPTRRLEVLIDAFARLRKERPDQDTRLTLIGGEPADVERLREHARSEGVADFVELTGKVPRHEVYDLLRDHDVGVVYIPRDVRYWVASPTKLIECLAIGLPVVSTDGCAMNAVLAEKSGAVIVTDDSTDGFARGLVTMLEDLDAWTKRARSGRDAILDEFDYSTSRQRMMTLLRDLATEAPRPDGPVARGTDGRSS